MGQYDLSNKATALLKESEWLQMRVWDKGCSPAMVGQPAVWRHL